jgi:hypothetical protein
LTRQPAVHGNAVGVPGARDRASGVEHTAAPIAQHDRQLLSYARCMRAHGVASFPDPVNGGFTVPVGSHNGPNSPQFQRANVMCAHLNP